MGERASGDAVQVRPSVWRVLGALALSGVLGGIAIGVLFTVLKLVQDGQGLAGLGVGLVMYSLIAIGFALPSALVFGGPAYWLLSRGKTVRFWPVVLSAGAVASLPLLVLVSGGWGSGAGGEDGPGGSLALTAVLFVMGCLGGLLFWRLSGLQPRRPPGD